VLSPPEEKNPKYMGFSHLNFPDFGVNVVSKKAGS
jgi:hypothetical protein